MRILPLALILLGACAPATAQQVDGSRIVQQLQQADGNGDGAVTRDEFRAHRKLQFTRADRNADGFISEDDVPAVIQGRLRDRLGGRNPGEKLVPQFDKNGDGKVNEAEFVDGPTTVFDAVDANGDDRVTSAEIAEAQKKFPAR